MKEQETKGKINKNATNIAVNAILKKEVTQQKTTSLDVFNQCIQRAENLISINEATKKIKSLTETHYCDCYRAAIVLSISALDAYIRKIVISEIIRIISDKGEINAKLREYLKGLLSQDKLLDAARHANLNEVVEKAIIEDFEKKSFQGEWKISTYMALIGHDKIFSEICEKTNKNEKTLIKQLNIYTNRRHIIAHRGDYDFSQTPHKENEIDENYAKNCIKEIRFFVETLDKIIVK